MMHSINMRSFQLELDFAKLFQHFREPIIVATFTALFIPCIEMHEKTNLALL